jgi:RND family efflux transporter MFP subunit
MLAGCEKLQSGQAAAPLGMTQQLPEVLVDLPTKAEVTDYEDFTGRTMAIKTIDIRARVTGYLENVHFTEGAEVKQGDLLFEIDPRTYQAEVNRTTSNVVQAEKHNERLTRDLQRAKVLLPNRTITPEEYDRAAGDQAEAEAAVGVAKAQLELAKQNLDYTQIRAPISGRMSRALIDPGNLVRADDTVLSSIVSEDPIYAYFGVDERLLKRIHEYIASGLIKKDRQGQIPILMGLAIEGTELPHVGSVNFIDNQLDTNTGTLQVRGVFPNPTHAIVPGLYCRIRLPLGEPYQAITIREQSLGTDQGQKFVYVVNDQNKIEYRKVQLGKQQGTQRVVLKGVAEGERVVVSGLQRVREGMQVKAKPFAATAENNAQQDGQPLRAATEPTGLNGEKR